MDTKSLLMFGAVLVLAYWVWTTQIGGTVRDRIDDQSGAGSPTGGINRATPQGAGDAILNGILAAWQVGSTLAQPAPKTS